MFDDSRSQRSTGQGPIGPVGLLLHGDDAHFGAGFHTALGVGCLASVATSILREDLVDDDAGHPVLVLDLHDLVGGDGLIVLHPSDHWVRVALHLDLELEP